MKKHFKSFLFSTFIIGILYGIGTVVFSYYKAPSFPGIFEVFVQLLLVFGFGLLFSISGIILWSLLTFLWQAYKKPISAPAKSVKFKEVASNLRLDEIAIMKSILNSSGIIYAVHGESFGTMRSVPSVIRLVVREDQHTEALELLKDFM